MQTFRFFCQTLLFGQALLFGNNTLAFRFFCETFLFRSMPFFRNTPFFGETSLFGRGAFLFSLEARLLFAFALRTGGGCGLLGCAGGSGLLRSVSMFPS